MVAAYAEPDETVLMMVTAETKAAAAMAPSWLENLSITVIVIFLLVERSDLRTADARMVA